MILDRNTPHALHLFSFRSWANMRSEKKVIIMIIDLKNYNYLWKNDYSKSFLVISLFFIILGFIKVLSTLLSWCKKMSVTFRFIPPITMTPKKKKEKKTHHHQFILTKYFLKKTYFFEIQFHMKLLLAFLIRVWFSCLFRLESQWDGV